MSSFFVNNSPNPNPQNAVQLKGTDNSSNERTITLSAPQNDSSLTADVTLVLPPDDGTSGQVLSTDGSGNLSWGSAGPTITSGSISDITFEPSIGGSLLAPVDVTLVKINNIVFLDLTFTIGLTAAYASWDGETIFTLSSNFRPAAEYTTLITGISDGGATTVNDIAVVDIGTNGAVVVDGQPTGDSYAGPGTFKLTTNFVTA